jgi:phage terminase small subunit
MGLRGPRKKLAQIEELEGNPSKRPIEAIGIEALGEPFVPDHLSDVAQGCLEVIKRSMPSGVYSALDTFHLSAFATAWAIHKHATHIINDPDFGYVTSGGLANPWLQILNKQAAIMASFGDRLGLDPKSRAALKLPSAKQQKSKFEGLIAIQGGRKG